ncbi:hypothetical protein AXFE_30390 [Acidithrix ferrooxidans]|uniref:Uncharacterized protein n=1 Tax=Acidithrix ferrooxidans TaxID=1280514 RepID=A0A0D8HDT6_9ACTN|nr:Druantia anti-phage system protein DruA [Acidithrix ferrooxidans]KJF16093.1 hypothetical protein AXFE_30390 [Acidithrix ferrooxidans]
MQEPPIDVGRISVRPILLSEQARFDAGLDEHHWLGHRLVSETMRYVALSPDGEWLALVGFGAAALACRPRDSFVGWSDGERLGVKVIVIDVSEDSTAKEDLEDDVIEIVTVFSARLYGSHNQKTNGLSKGFKM